MSIDSRDYVREMFGHFLRRAESLARISACIALGNETIEFTLDEIGLDDEMLAKEIFNDPGRVQDILDRAVYDVMGTLYANPTPLSKIHVAIKGVPRRYDINAVEYYAEAGNGKREQHRCIIDIWETPDANEKFVKLRDECIGKEVLLRGKDLVRQNVFPLLQRYYGDDLPTISKLVKKLTPYFITVEEKEEKKFSEEIRRSALKLAKDPALLKIISEDIGRGHVGDEESRLLVFVLLCSSRLLGHEQSLIIQKSSGAGGSDLQNKVLAYFDNVREATRITGAVPDRIGKDFTGQILKVEELKGAEAAQNTLRVMISEGNLTLWTTQKDENGNIVTAEIKTKGTPSFITTTVEYQVEEQFLNRLWIVGVDETKDQTRSVVKFQFGKFSGLQDHYTPNEAIRCLISPTSGILDSKLAILIPYSSLLGDLFPADTTTARRDSLKFATLVAINAWLHQHQRPILKTERNMSEERVSYVVATLVDLVQVLNYAPTALKNTLFKLNERAFAVLTYLEERDVDLTYAEIGRAMGLGSPRARQICKALEELGYVDIDTGQKTHTMRASGKELKFGEIHSISQIIRLFGPNEVRRWLNSLVDKMKSDGYKVELPDSVEKNILS